MTNRLASTRQDNKEFDSEQGTPRKALAQLRDQSWRVGVLLFSPWLLTVVLCWPNFYNGSVSIIALLPGLAIALHIHNHLARHLPNNHRPFEETRLFPTLGMANWITLLRASAVIGLAGFLPLAIMQDSSLLNFKALAWAAGLIYLGISMADLLDGFVARRQGRETKLGKQLDIVTDAAGLLVASAVAVAMGRLPIIYLLVGLAYYIFIFGIWLRQKKNLPVVVLQSRPYARIIAGVQMGLVGMALLPIFDPAFTYLAAYIFMTPLLVGFCRDWLVVSCRLKTDKDQQSSWDFRMKALMRHLPLALRLIITAGGITTLACCSIAQTNPSWQLAQSLLCLLASIGFLGRSTGLSLVLLLGSSQSPFGLTLLSMTIFSAAAGLMLTGAGPKALWDPEENILYRRFKTSLTTNGKAS